MSMEGNAAKPGMHVLAKPIGPLCDIKCDYCFYLEKRALFDDDKRYRMSDEVLAAYIDQYVTAREVDAVPDCGNVGMGEVGES